MLYVRWPCVRNTLVGRYMRAQCRHTWVFSSTKAQSHIVDARPTHWKIILLTLWLDWRWSHVLLASTFTRGKTLTFLIIQKMCAEVDAHKKWMTFISVLVKSSTNSDARPANHNALTKILHFLCAGRAWWYVWLGLEVLFELFFQNVQQFALLLFSVICINIHFRTLVTHQLVKSLTLWSMSQILTYKDDPRAERVLFYEQIERLKTTVDLRG